jgi:hypothetical protein
MPLPLSSTPINERPPCANSTVTRVAPHRAVLDQFAHDRRRTFHDFARGDWFATRRSTRMVGMGRRRKQEQ